MKIKTTLTSNPLPSRERKIKERENHYRGDLYV